MGDVSIVTDRSASLDLRRQKVTTRKLAISLIGKLSDVQYLLLKHCVHQHNVCTSKSNGRPPAKGSHMVAAGRPDLRSGQCSRRP
jgi:hypothetical protein